jgi:hypothetical protein
MVRRELSGFCRNPVNLQVPLLKLLTGMEMCTGGAEKNFGSGENQTLDAPIRAGAPSLALGR